MVPFPPCGPPCLGHLLAWTVVLAPCFFFSPFFGSFLFIKFGRVHRIPNSWDFGLHSTIEFSPVVNVICKINFADFIFNTK